VRITTFVSFFNELIDCSALRIVALNFSLRGDEVDRQVWCQ
jgi:hypothetical protein